MGTSDESEVGFTRLLSGGEKFPDVRDHAGTTEHHLPGRGVGECGEALVEYSIPISSAKPCHQVLKDLWPYHSVGTSPPSLLPHCRGGGPQACATGG